MSDSGQPELALQTGHTAWVISVVFSPDGLRLASAGSDREVRLWNVATGDELVCLVHLRSEGDWFVVTPEGLFDGSRGGREKVAYRVGGGLNVVPVDHFIQDFYYPGLLSAIWCGERLCRAQRMDRRKPLYPRGVCTTQIKPGTRVPLCSWHKNWFEFAHFETVSMGL